MWWIGKQQHYYIIFHLYGVIVKIWQILQVSVCKAKNITFYISYLSIQRSIMLFFCIFRDFYVTFSLFRFLLSWFFLLFAHKHCKLYEFAQNLARESKRAVRIFMCFIYSCCLWQFFIYTETLLSDLFCVRMILQLVLLSCCCYGCWSFLRLLEIRKYVVRVTQIVGHAYKYKHSNWLEIICAPNHLIQHARVRET